MKMVKTEVRVNSSTSGRLVSVDFAGTTVRNLGKFLQEIGCMLGGYVCMPGTITVEIETELVEEEYTKDHG